ncbi:MAG TPA: hypothetical protein VFP53_03360, partial [Sphingomicrobium sp.]|nr:hypothetical protein [Sphingomicrobium sp.]
NRMRLNLVLLASASIAACNQAPVTQEPDGPIRTDERNVTANGDVTLDSDASDSTPAENKVRQAGDLPEPGAGPRFVGKWAADMKSCTSSAWQFTETSLTTPAGSSCSFNRVTEVPGGYDIQATCTAEGPPAGDTLKLRFAESAKALLFESNVIADTGLIFCGREV